MPVPYNNTSTGPRDKWEYKGHDIVYGPHGNYELHIDGEDVTGDLVGHSYTREIVKTYIDENYEDGGPSIGSGTLDDYPWRDDE